MRPMVPVHGGQLRQLALRLGVDPERLSDFSANINPEGPPASVVAALRDALDEPAVLASYPDLEERALREAISRHAGIDVEQVVVGNGVVPLLEAVLRALKVARCLLPVPSFSEYRSTLERVGAVVTPYRLRPEHDFGYRREGLLVALRQGGHDALLLANPQNPSGSLCARDELLALVEEAASLNVRVLLDEAFIDYAASHSLVGEAHRLPNLTIFRSLTKFYSVPGLRVAYGVVCPSLHADVDGQMAAWPITTLASLGARAALADEAYAADVLAVHALRRERLVRGMNALGVATYAPGANFLLLRLPGGVDASRCWERMVVDHGIVLRDCSNFEGLAPGHLRCLVRSDADNELLLRALRSVLPSAV